MTKTTVTITAEVSPETKDKLKEEALKMQGDLPRPPGVNTVAGAILDAALSEGAPGCKDQIANDMNEVYVKGKSVIAKGLSKAGGFLSGLGQSISGDKK